MGTRALTERYRAPRSGRDDRGVIRYLFGLEAQLARGIGVLMLYGGSVLRAACWGSGKRKDNLLDLEQQIVMAIARLVRVN